MPEKRFFPGTRIDRTLADISLLIRLSTCALAIRVQEESGFSRPREHPRTG